MTAKVQNISYFRLSLTELLRENFPELLANKSFITARSETAAEAYAQAVANGSSQMEAAEQSNIVLFKDLHFSKHDTLKNVIWNEFSDKIPENEAKDLAIRLLPECEEIFVRYSLHDNFAYEVEYELLYTELTGTIALIIENHNL